jgi:hypothetical protein
LGIDAASVDGDHVVGPDVGDQCVLAFGDCHGRLGEITARLCLVAGVWVFLSRAERIEPGITAEEFRLVDKAGRVRAVLGIMSQGPSPRVPR